MIRRCYCEKNLTRKPAYRGCTVCTKWLNYSTFKEWFDLNYIEGYAIDKDILVEGNREYSPEKCCFVPIEINNLFISTTKGVYHTGVSFLKNYGKYEAYYWNRNRKVNVGYYDNLEDAVKAYIFHKKQYVQEIAEEYFANKKINVDVYKAIVSRDIV